MEKAKYNYKEPETTEEILMDVIWQTCGVNDCKFGNYIDNKCISAYEDACEHLERLGYLKKHNDRTYLLTEKATS